MMLFLKQSNNSYFYPFSVTFFFFSYWRNFPAYSGSTLRSRALPEYLFENADSSSPHHHHCEGDLQSPMFGQAEVPELLQSTKEVH